MSTPTRYTGLGAEWFALLLYRDISLPNFIRRCLKRSANASNSLGSVSVSGCKPAAATAAAIAGWWEPGWPWCPRRWNMVSSYFLHLNVSRWRPTHLIMFTYSCWYLTSGSPMDRRDDAPSCGSCCDTSRAADGGRRRWDFQTWAWGLSWSRSGLACPSRPLCDASEER